MSEVKLSTLKTCGKVIVENEVMDVSELLEDVEYYKYKKVYTTSIHRATLNAKEVLGDAIEDEYCNFMYEDWDEIIGRDIKDEDIEDMQKILDRILERSPEQDIAYIEDKLIKFDI